MILYRHYGIAHSSAADTAASSARHSLGRPGLVLGHRVGLLHLDSLQHAHLHLVGLLQRADRLGNVAHQVVDLTRRSGRGGGDAGGVKPGPAVGILKRSRC